MEHDAQQPDENQAPPPTTPTEMGPPEAGPPVAGPPPLTDAEARSFAMLAHVSTFSGVVIPFGHVLAPLIIWLLKREQSDLVDDQAKEVLNFQISMTIYYVVGVLLLFVLIGFLVLPALFIFSVVVTIMGAVRANAGERYRYPLNLRLVK